MLEQLKRRVAELESRLKYIQDHQEAITELPPLPEFTLMVPFVKGVGDPHVYTNPTPEEKKKQRIHKKLRKQVENRGFVWVRVLVEQQKRRDFRVSSFVFYTAFDYWARKASTSFSNSLGSDVGAKRLMVLPSFEIRNLVKFHWMSLSDLAVSLIFLNSA